jgi:hypothetical protein
MSGDSAAFSRYVPAIIRVGQPFMKYPETDISHFFKRMTIRVTCWNPVFQTPDLAEKIAIKFKELFVTG